MKKKFEAVKRFETCLRDFYLKKKFQNNTTYQTFHEYKNINS